MDCFVQVALLRDDPVTAEDYLSADFSARAVSEDAYYGGAGSDADAQYLFAKDVLVYSRGHRPRKTYRNSAAKYARPQGARVAAFGRFVADVRAGRHPARAWPWMRPNLQHF
jgi:hypothetical protein